jgi:anthranilate phosphoribosyltransferase
LAKNHLFLVSKTENAIKHQVFKPANGTSNSLKEIQGNSPKESAEIVKKVLQGEKGLAREIAVLNSAAGLFIAGKVTSINEGIGLAEELIDSSAALQKLIDFREASHLN